jgi:SpoIIAA-like
MSRGVLMIEVLTGLPPRVAGVVAHGELSAEDYRDGIRPALEAAFAAGSPVRMLFVLDSDFEGFSGGAIWQDAKTGLSHPTGWERVAVVGDVSWVSHSVQMFGFLMPGEVRAFSLADRDAATDWVTEGTSSED